MNSSCDQCHCATGQHVSAALARDCHGRPGLPPQSITVDRVECSGVACDVIDALLIATPVALAPHGSQEREHRWPTQYIVYKCPNAIQTNRYRLIPSTKPHVCRQRDILLFMSTSQALTEQQRLQQPSLLTNHSLQLGLHMLFIQV